MACGASRSHGSYRQGDHLRRGGDNGFGGTDLLLSEFGVVIADARTKGQNGKVSFSIFTQQFCSSGSPYSRVLETPTFGHNENHAALQAGDWVCSGLVFPMAAHTYCTGHVTNVHVHPGYSIMKQEFGGPLMALQHRYRESSPNRRWRGGLVLSDELAHRPGR